MKKGASRAETERRTKPWGLRKALPLHCLVVFAIAMAVRVAVLVTLADSPFFVHPVIDARYHDAWAAVLARDRAARDDAQRHFLSQPYFKPPFYPWLLGRAYRLFGRTPWPVKIIQAGLGALGCVWVFLIGKRLFGRSAAWIGALLASVYWPWIFFDAWLLNTELVIFLDLSAAWLLLGAAERPRAWRWLAAGLLAGASAITWPTGLLVVGGVGWWIGCVTVRSQPVRARLAAAALFLCAAGAPVFAVAVRNRAIGKDAVLISSNGGINFYTGNRPEADGMTAVPTGIQWERLIRETDRLAIERPSEVSRYWFRKGWRHVRAAPMHALLLSCKRAALFFNAAEPRNNLAQGYFRRTHPWLRALAGFGLLGPLWFFGVWLWWVATTRRERPWAAAGGGLCLVYVLARWVGVLPFFVCDRFRVVAVPFMAPMAGLAVVGLWHAAKTRRLRRILPPAAALIMLGVLVGVDWFHAEPRTFAQEHFLLGHIAAKQGDLDAAERALRTSLSLDDSADAHLVMSYILMSRKDFRNAATAARRALALAPDAADAHGNLAGCLAELHQPAAALAAADAAVRLAPRNPRHRLLRATLLLRLGRAERACADLKAARDLPMNPVQITLYRRLARAAGMPR